MREVWLPIIGYAGLYEASNLGRIRRDPVAPARSLGVPGQCLRPHVHLNGYYTVDLSLNGLVTRHRLHRAVLSAFCGPEPFEGAHAAHNDGDKSNNALTNLRWASPIENQADVKRHGSRCAGENVYGAVLNDAKVSAIRERIATGERNPSIAADFGVSKSTIHLIRHGRIWRHVA